MSAAADTLALLTQGTVTVRGRLPGASNATFLVEVAHEDEQTLAVYKPGRGERPLWDFPRGLYRREVAAFLLSEALGWDLVPATVLRDGPYDEGSIQLFVDADFEQHYFTLREDPAHRDRLIRLCAFDLVCNNADRKAGHCLLGADGLVYAIDNGLSFHVEPKLRTVIWDFAGEAVPAAVLADLRRVAGARLPRALQALLAPNERDALLARCRALIAVARFPAEPGGRAYPWPLV